MRSLMQRATCCSQVGAREDDSGTEEEVSSTNQGGLKSMLTKMTANQSAIHVQHKAVGAGANGFWRCLWIPGVGLGSRASGMFFSPLPGGPVTAGRSSIDCQQDKRCAKRGTRNETGLNEQSGKLMKANPPVGGRHGVSGRVSPGHVRRGDATVRMATCDL